MKKRLVEWLRKKLQADNSRLASELAFAREELKAMRSQLMRLRVAQAEAPRRGWEVMAYIPQEVADRLGGMSAGQKDHFVRSVAYSLVAFAIQGLHHVNSMGRVNALVFEPMFEGVKPRAAKWVQVVFEKDGKFKMSERLNNLLDDPETRVKKACGL